MRICRAIGWQTGVNFSKAIPFFAINLGKQAGNVYNQHGQNNAGSIESDQIALPHR